METSTYTVTISHDDSTNAEMLADSIKSAIAQGLRCIDSLVVNRTAVDYHEPAVYFYMLECTTGTRTIKMPISSRNENLEVASAEAHLADKNIEPRGFDCVVGIDLLDRETFMREMDNLDPADVRWEDTFERGCVKYYKVVASDILTDSASSIMSTKIRFDEEGFKHYAVRLGKTSAFENIESIEEISKDEYFCIKFGATGKSEQYLAYKIKFSEEGEEKEITFKTKFIFPSHSGVFVQAQRKGKISHDAILDSVLEVSDDSSEGEESED